MSDGDKVWMVFEWKGAKAVPEFCGVFANEDAAVAKCTRNCHCVCPAMIGETLADKAVTWPGAWYPKLQNKPEVAP